MRTAENNFLRELQQRLALEDKTLEMYGFPTPRGNTTEIERENKFCMILTSELSYTANYQLKFQII